jgi:hypothetical protein
MTLGRFEIASAMNKVYRSRHFALCTVSALIFTVCFYYPKPAQAAGQSTDPIAEIAPDDVQFTFPRQYDTGVQTSVALLSSGLVLEFHKAQNDAGIWYRLGGVAGTDVKWSNQSIGADVNGYWPAVAVSKEGYVILVWSNLGVRTGSEQFYRVGRIEPDGGPNQSIGWLTHPIHWDGGFHTSIAINDNGVIVGVHESNSFSNSNVYYRVGKLRNPAGGDFTIQWDSGHIGINYDIGIDPHIAINNHNEVVAVHEVPGEYLLHYRRGTVSGGRINFGGSQRYDGYGQQPAVALLDSGLVLELHIVGQYRILRSRVGQLSLSGPALIEWSEPMDRTYDCTYPALAANESYAIETHEQGIGSLFYCIAEISDGAN